MGYAINASITLSKRPEGPFESHLSKFANCLKQDGYPRKSIHYRVLIASCFSGWVYHQGIKISCVTNDHCHQYLRYRTQSHKPRNDDSYILIKFLDFLRKEDVIPAATIPEHCFTEVEKYTQAYVKYLTDVRGLTQSTIVNYVLYARGFLEERFGDGSIDLSCICANDVVKFVQCEAPRLGKKRAKLMITALRSLFKYTRFSSDTSLDLAAAVPVVANWSTPSIPRAIPVDQVNDLLARMDRRTAVGSRDYAIIMLLARLGLRLSEVTFLELDDIDWNNGLLKVRTKGGRHNEFPLSSEVGEAIANYLKKRETQYPLSSGVSTCKSADSGL